MGNQFGNKVRFIVGEPTAKLANLTHKTGNTMSNKSGNKVDFMAGECWEY